MSDLTLSLAGVNVAKRILLACQRQRDDYCKLEDLIMTRFPQRREELLSHDFGVRYVNEVERLWRKEGRQVLSIHPDLLKELQVATSTEIVPEVYRTIPYLNPMVVFPEPPEISSWTSDQERMRVLGFFVHGRSQKSRLINYELTDALQSGQVIMSSHDPDMEKLGLVIVTEIIDADSGEGKTWEYNRTAIDLSHPQTIDKIAQDLVDTYNWTILVKKGGDRQRRKQFMTDVYSLVIGSLLYLCSTVMDAEVVPKSRVRRVMGRGSKPVTLTNVGWKIGPALTRRRRESGERGQYTPTGRRLPPHMRKCHLKVVWTGKGRTIPKTAFIAPYWVNRDLLDDTVTPTVRVVRS